MKEYYMKIAINEAQKALKNGEMPVGAVIVKNNKIIGKGYNKKEKTKNALMHAEIIAIQKACKKNKDWRLNNCELYVTMEPCLMCIGAIVESRIKKIYCGVENKKNGEINKKIYANENIQFEDKIEKEIILNQIETFFKKIRNK